MAKLKPGHWWTYTFHNVSNKSNSPYIDLFVEAIAYDPQTFQVHEVTPNAKMHKTIHPRRGGTIFELDIKSGIEAVYEMAKIEQPVYDAYLYHDIAISATGMWESFNMGGQELVKHDSYLVTLEASSQHKIRFGTQFSGKPASRGLSVPYSALNELVAAEIPHTMTTHFGNDADDKQAYLFHTMSANDRLHFLGGEALPAGGVKIDVSPTKVQINIPSGFDLKSFTVDPKAGHGG